MIKMKGIYYIKNKTNSKIYIGQSVDINKRFNSHKHLLRNNNHSNSHLQASYNKYGADNFEFGLIKCTKEKYLNRLEKLFIRKYDSTDPTKGYNYAKGGNSNSGWTMPQKTRNKIREALKGENSYWYGKTFSKEHKKKLSESLKGKKLSEAHKQKLSEAFKGKNHPFYGKHHTEETKQKISKSKKGQMLSEETKELLSEIRAKYTLWNYKKVGYDKSRIKDPDKVYKAFRLKYNKKNINIGRFEEFITPTIIYNLIEEMIE